jgi:hypothetical protein
MYNIVVKTNYTCDLKLNLLKKFKFWFILCIIVIYYCVITTKKTQIRDILDLVFNDKKETTKWYFKIYYLFYCE